MEHNYLDPDWITIGSFMRLDQEPFKLNAVKGICEDIQKNMHRYQAVSDLTRVPAILLGALHYREASLNFNCMLHNGEPLGIVSRIVPVGVGPFASWENSAVDALRREGCGEIALWDFGACLKFAEAYNGKGYRKRGLYSPYVTSFTNMSDEVGGYPSDGKYSDHYLNKRPGVGALMLGMIGKYEP